MTKELGVGVWGLGFGVWSLGNSESRISNSESRISNPEFRIPNPESRIPNVSIQEQCALFWTGHAAGVGLAEPFIATIGDEIIDRIAHECWHD